MKKKQQSQIFQAINGLTNDDDQRQELWCYYLSGAHSSVLQKRLDNINRDNETYDRLQKAIWLTYKNPPSQELLDFLNNFSELERSIMFLLLVGLSVDEVSKYKDISIIRVQQIVAAIRNNQAWENEWLLKDTLQTKRSTD